MTTYVTGATWRFGCGRIVYDPDADWYRPFITYSHAVEGRHFKTVEAAARSFDYGQATINQWHHSHGATDNDGSVGGDPDRGGDGPG